MDKIYILYNLVENNEVPARIDRIIDRGFSFEELLTINETSFFEKFGMKKKDLYYSVNNFVNFNKDCNFADLSIYYLLRHGISKRTIDGVFQKGLTKLFYILLFEPSTIQEAFNLKDIEVSKLYATKDELLMCFYSDLSTVDINRNPIFADLLRKDFKTSCYKIINESGSLLAKTDIFHMLKDYQKNYFNLLINDVLSELINENKIKEFNAKYQVRKPLLEEFIAQLDLSERKNRYFVLHMDGLTYEEIAQNESITRERVRQLIKKVDSDFIDELKYLDIYNKYSIEEDDFVQIFDCSTRVYRFLRYKSKKKISFLPLIELSKEEILTEEQKSIADKLAMLYEKCLVIDNSIVKANGVAVLGFYFKKYLHQPKKLTQIYDGYCELLNENNISHLKCSYKSFINKVNDLKYSINNKNGYRYFDVFEDDIVYAIKNLDLSHYRDVEISAKVIYDNNLDVMLNNNILDEYELYALLKTHRNDNDIEFNRIPIINFGNGDRNRQIESIIIEFSPITTEDFANKYNELYGFEKNSITSYAISNFTTYYQNSKFDLTAPILPMDIINKLKTLITKDFYFKEDVLSIISNSGIKFEDKYFNRINLSLIGYKSNCSYIFSNKYNSFIDYLNENYYNHDFINFENIDHRMYSLSTFTDSYYQKCISQEIIQYDSFKFVKFSYLEQNGLSRKDIEIFRKKLIQYINSGYIFSLRSLKESGFSDKLFGLGFDDYFYNSIIRHTDNIYSRRIGYTKDFIFRYNDSEKSFPTFIELFEQILSIYGVMSPEDLSRYLKDNYGIERDASKIKTLVSESGIYYDIETNNFYYGKESFKEEVMLRIEKNMYGR